MIEPDIQNQEPLQEVMPDRSRPSPPSPIKASILTRVKVLYAVLSLLCIAILAKIIWIQVGTSGDELRGAGVRSSFQTEIIEPTRGNILADDGRILTTSLPQYELRLDFAAHGLQDSTFRKALRPLSDSLSAFFKDQPSSAYTKKLQQGYLAKNRYFSFAPRKVNFVELERIKRFPLFNLGPNTGGFIAIAKNKRVHPLGNVAGRTIGFVNSNGVKLGLEGGFDDVLRGVDGLTVKQKISGDFWIPINSDLNLEPTPGLDLVTTIDIELQDIAQTSLRERLEEVEADWGTVVIMEVSTGHIKAIANATRLKTGEVVEDYNYAIGMSIEPGSTFKLPVLLALLDDAKMPISETMDTEGGQVTIGRARVRDSHSGGYGVVSLERAFEVSSNVAMAKAVNRYYTGREEKFVEAIKRMGIGKPTGLKIPGEGQPLVKNPKMRSKGGWDGTTLTMMAYGYATHLTPLQTLTIYNAVANDGKMVRPQLVTALMSKGDTVQLFPSEVMIDQIASPSTIKLAQRAMRGVVLNGTARVLQSDKYTVAAKTGTAQIAIGNKGYSTSDGSRHYLGSIAGYFPAENPKYSMIIAIKTFSQVGANKIYYGVALASPVFRTIVDRIHGSSFQFLSPVGDGSSRDLTLGFANRQRPAKGAVVPTDSLSVPIVLGMDLRSALSVLEERGFKVRYSGRGRVASYRLDGDSTLTTREITLLLE